MKRRNIAAIVVLPFITFGIYMLYWAVKTKGELNNKGAQIPTAWLIIIPLVNIWWIWKYFKAAEAVSDGEINGVLMFVIELFLGLLIPMIVCQISYNKIAEEGVSSSQDHIEDQGESLDSTLPTQITEVPNEDQSSSPKPNSPTNPIA